MSRLNGYEKIAWKRITLNLLVVFFIIIGVLFGVSDSFLIPRHKSYKKEKTRQEQEEEKTSVEVKKVAEEENQVDELTETRDVESFVYDIPAGTILEEKDIEGYENSYFQSFEIMEGDPVYERIIGKSYVSNTNIGLSELRYLKMLHYNFNHVVQMGEMIVNDQIDEDVLEIFRYLYQNEYEIESMHLIDDYWQGDGESSDTASMEVNNTSAFCYRLVTGGSTLSRHALGYAIDVNPQQNPYVIYDSNGNPSCNQENAWKYMDRSSGNPHVIVQGDSCYNIFTQYGYIWGGNWDNPVDYQHFQKK